MTATALHCTGDLLQSKLGVCGEGWVRGGWSNHLISKLARSVLVVAVASCSCVPPTSACCTIIASSASTFGLHCYTGYTATLATLGRGGVGTLGMVSCKPHQHQTTDCYPQIETAIVCCYSQQRKQQQHGCDSL